MHELSLASAIVDTVERHADGRAVTAVQLRVGRLRQVVPDSLEFYFELVARETVCDGARLELEIVPAELHCRICAHEWRLVEPLFRCPECGERSVDVLAGEEFEVESIQVETQEEQCIART